MTRYGLARDVCARDQLYLPSLLTTTPTKYNNIGSPRRGRQHLLDAIMTPLPASDEQDLDMEILPGRPSFNDTAKNRD
jgi:hypothetical protein